LTGWALSYVQEKRAIRSEILARRQAYDSDLLLASTVASRGNHALSKALLDRHRIADHMISDVNITKHSHRIDWRILASKVPSQPVSLAQFPTKNYFGIHLAINRELACGSRDSHLRILDSATGNLRLDIATDQGEINGLALSPDGLTIATGGDDGTVKFWNLNNGQLLNQFHASGDHVFQIGWSGDGKHFVTVGDEPDAKIWTYPSLDLQRTIPTDGELLECLAIGREGQIAVGSDKGVIRITTADTLDLALDQKIAATMSRVFHVNRCSSLAFSHTGRLMASGLDNGYLILFRRNRSEYEIVERLRFPTTVTSIAFAEDERSLAIGENNGSVHVLKLPAVWPTTSKLRFTKFFLDENSQTLQDPTGDPSTLWDVVRKVEPSDARERISLDVDRVYIEFSKPMKNVLLSDNYIREWMDENGNSLPTWNEIPSNTIYKESGIELQFENRHSGWSTMNDLQIQGRLTSWSYHSKRVASVAWDASSGGIYSFSEDGHVKRKMVDEVQAVNVGGGNIGTVIPLKNRRLVLSTPDDRSRVISLAQKSSEMTKSQVFDEGHVQWTCFVEYGEVVYFVKEIRGSSGVDENYLYAWDFATGVSKATSKFPLTFKVRSIIGAISESLMALQIESDEPAYSGNAKSCQIACWDISHQKIIWETQKRISYARLAKATSDGRRLAYVFDGELYLVDTTNGEEKWLGDLAGAQIRSTCFSPDSRYLAVALSDNTIRCFDALSGRFLWSIQTPGSPSVDLVWSKDLITLLTVAQDGFLRAFDTTLHQMTIEVPLTTKNPISIRLSPEDDWIYILDRDGTLIQMPSGEL
ncbi:MAG: WD40 repeat domain-containing protein, partial [Planctomycetota bacterium]